MNVHELSSSLGFRPNLNTNLIVKPSQSSRFRSLAVFRSSTLFLSCSLTNNETSTAERDKKIETLSSVSPLYVPTPSNRELRTPHSGYHFDGTARRFFEGWYFRVSIPERKQSFCFMYAIENPSFRNKLTPLEIAQHGSRSTGVMAQILGADDKYICQCSEESQNFWGSMNLCWEVLL